MKISTKSLVVGLSLVAALAISAAPSEAAKHKRMAKCDPGHACTANCKSGSCEIRRCDADGKSYSYLPAMTCGQLACPAAKC